MRTLNLDYFEEKNITFITGIGKNKHIARLISDSFQSIGYKIIFVDTTDMQHGSIGLLKAFPNAALILLSKTGLTKEIRNFGTLIKKECPTIEQWLVTSNENVVFDEGQVVFVDFYEEIDEDNIFPSYSLISFLDYFYRMMKPHFIKNKNFISNHPEGGLHLWRKK